MALQEEIDFWREFFETGGLHWPRDFEARFDPDLPIQDYVMRHLDGLEGNRLRILDVGSGPLTSLGKKHPSKQLTVTAIDLLASEYDRLLDDLGVEPLVRTIYGDAERLVEHFGQDTFDIVHGRNCIDHMLDPVRAIYQMLAVSKCPGFVILYHGENEGKKQQYEQLHKWDFTCEDGHFVIRDQAGRTTDVTNLLSSRAEVKCSRLENGAILTGIWKRAD